MLEGLRGIGGKSHRQAEELQALVASAKEEYGALSAMLTQLSVRGSKLAQVGKTLEQVDLKAADTAGRLGDIVSRIDGLEARAAAMSEAERRVQQLIGTIEAAQQAVAAMTGPDGELQQHQKALRHLSSQALETRASLEALTEERVEVEELRAELRRTRDEITQAIAGAATARGDLDEARGAATQLAQDVGRLRETSRDAREDALTASDAVHDMEKRIEPLLQLTDLVRTTDERLVSLNALSTHVLQKVRALDGQQHVVDRAVSEANRLNGMVWGMDLQVKSLGESLHKVAETEATVSRIESLVADAGTKVDLALRARDEVSREVTRLDQDGRALADALRLTLDRLSVETREVEATDGRLHILQAGVADAEDRMESLLAKERGLAGLHQRLDEMSQGVQNLQADTDDLGRKQAELDSLRVRLAEIDDLGRKTAVQAEALEATRAEVASLAGEIAEFHKAHADAAQLRDRLGADRVALEGFAVRMGDFLTRAPQIEASVAGVTERLHLVEAGLAQADRLDERVRGLEAHVARVLERAEFVSRVESRVDELQAVSAEVDRRMADQLQRRAELDGVKAQADSVGVQMLDAAQKVEAVAAAQARLLPVVERLSGLEAQLTRSE